MYTIFIPVYNESEILEDNVLRVREYMQSLKLDHEVIVVSNGSTDDTEKIGQQLASQCDWFRFFTIEGKGVGLAFSKGVQEAKGEFIISLDADLSSELTFINFARDLLAHADMVVGSKTMGTQRRGLIRILGSQTYILFTQIFFDLTISDYSLGAKAYRRDKLLPLLGNLDSWTGYVFEICVWLRQQRGRIIQVGIECEDTRASRFNLLHEGFYRYRHLYQTWKRMRQSPKWLAEKG